MAGQCDGVEFEKEGSQLTANNLNSCGISGAEYDAAGAGKVGDSQLGCLLLGRNPKKNRENCTPILGNLQKRPMS